MLKPLSNKTLQKKYEELGLPIEKTDLLHRYFRCFSNLYGVINMAEAWEIFRDYEGKGYIKKKEFLAFSGIAQREEQPYAICELNEVYAEEENVTEKDRLLINRDLIRQGYGRFMFLWDLVDKSHGYPLYHPDRETFLGYEKDLFWETSDGITMKQYVENLKSEGICINYPNNKKSTILDLDGNSVKGRRLKDIVTYTQNELFDIDYEKKEERKEKLKKEYAVPASVKILNRIRKNILCGIYMGAFSDGIEYLVSALGRDYGICFSEKELQHFIDLYTSLHNNSHQWQLGGNAPSKLYRMSCGGMPTEIEFGPGIKKAMAEGQIDREILERFLENNGIKIR